ncbi:FimV/HubP family polar landmark protein [Stutzerimonas stutzeri]|uniref:FimV/HubP family polar landmark protein n=1 Tax=Stutzerimonas stutzeri TaxID=316 RepID=UPI00265ADEF9|nr:FimV/HubP family polar landmark protein [Stutzerimonas stutzeri]MCF6783164.1 peptigoglycan-binding protein LysM [Stutzerimonas stutzeri]MCF6806112.1 peptigoglycan-binding protein LysM [Stutzerimonas stutzeri]
MVRVRNLVLAIAAATALTSEMVYALGVGEVTLKSALNQPLVAEIELLDAKTLAPGEVVPGLASAEDFNRAGIDRPYFLTDLTFTPVLRPDGKNIIRVSSTKPVREPYLNFLVEVLWPSGRLLREYTLLLDPPLYSPETAAAVAPQLPTAAPVARPTGAPRGTSQAAPARSSTAASPAGNEYKVASNDTLWEIAERTRQGGTVHQAMLAIQDLNPDAFIGGNINRMKNGQVLRLPSAEQIASRSQTEAIEQVAQQNASWRQGRAQPVSERQLDARQRSAAGAAPSRSETGDSLRLVAPETGRSTAGSDTGTAADAKALRDRLATAEESLDSSRRENLDLNDRLKDLEGQLEKLQRLMQLKDDQLAKLQAQLGAEPVGETAAPEEAVVASGSAEAEAPGADIATEPEAAEPETAVTPVAQEAGSAAKPAPAAAPAPATPAAPPAEPVADSYLQQLMANPLLLAALGGSALLLLLVALMAVSRRNAMKEAELQESLLADSEPDNLYVEKPVLAVADLEVTDNQVVAPASDDALDSIAGMANDPIAEADIYIAYGRFNQAADLLQSALNDEPQRTDLRLKLMEVYAELGDRDGFARQEAELRDIGGSSASIDQLKSRYPAMGFGAVAGVAAAGTAASDFDSFNLDDFESDQPAPAAALDPDDAFDLSLDDLQLDDDFSATAAPVAEPAKQQPDALDKLNFDDLNLETEADTQPADDFSFELDELSSPVADASLADELESFSLELDEELPAATESEFSLDEVLTDSAAGVEQPADSFDFDLPELETEQSASMPDEFDLSLDDELSENARPETFAVELDEIEAELGDISRDLEEPLDVPQVGDEPAPTNLSAAPIGESSDDMGDDDFDFFAETDETTTKLDLARAYIDMGDAEGARDILDEVMVEGSDTQQQEAREMLAKLA